MDAIEGGEEELLELLRPLPSGILHRAVEVLQMLVGMLKRLRGSRSNMKEEYGSEAFSRLLAMLRAELSDDYFVEIEKHLTRLKFRSGVLIRARLGKGNKGKDYTLRKPHEDDAELAGATAGGKAAVLFLSASSAR